TKSGRMGSSRWPRSTSTASRMQAGRPKSMSASMAARMLRPVNSTSSTRTTVAPSIAGMELGRRLGPRLGLRAGLTPGLTLGLAPGRAVGAAFGAVVVFDDFVGEPANRAGDFVGPEMWGFAHEKRLSRREGAA